MSSIVKVSLWLTLSELAFNLSGYLIHSLLGRFLGPTDYGRYSLVITLSTMIVVLVGRGVPVAMSKYLSEVKKNPTLIRIIRSEAAKIQFVLISFLTLIYFFLSPFFAQLLKDPSLTPLFRVSSLIIPAFALASFYFYYYTGIQAFAKQAFLKFNRALIKVILIPVLGYFFGVMGAIIGQALTPFSVFLDAYLIDPLRKIKKGTVNHPNFHFSQKKLLQFAWPMIVFMIFYEIMISIDLYLVKALLKNDSLTGFYSAALTIGRIPFYAFYFLTIILLPKISETTANNLNEKTSQIMKKSMRFLMMFLFPTVTLITIFAPSAIRFFYGAKFTQAASSLMLLSFGMGFLTIFYILAFVLSGAGKNKIAMKIAIGGAILNTVLGFTFIPRFNIQGAALATTLTSFLTMLIILIITNQQVTNFFEIKSTFKFLLTSLIVAILTKNLPQGRFIFILWSIIFMAFYLFFLFLLKEINKNDWIFLKKSLFEKKTKNSSNGKILEE